MRKPRIGSLRRPRVPAKAWVWAACLTLLTGCAPKVDQSGWEIARKKSPTERLETYPDIPLVLPGQTLPPPQATGTAIESVLKQQLDVGSLFRRGYSAPTP